jgi:hypothetical protein
MWGNVQGWFISACMTVLLAWPLWLASQPPKPSKPSGSFPNLLSAIQLPTDPKTLGPAMDDDCNAGEVYARVLEEYEANRRLYDEKYLPNPRLAQAERPKAVEILLEAAHCSRMNLFSRRPADVLNYNPDTPAVDAIEKVGRMANQFGLLYRLDKKPDEARLYFEAMFALGYHLYSERMAWSEFVAGVNLLTDAARGLARLEADAGNSDKAKSLEAFADSADQYKLKQLDVYRVVNSIDGPTIGRHGGDVLALARHSPESMWRGEAILALGRMRFNTPNKGDQNAATREVRLWVTDPDPAVRAAASAASNLTLEKYRTLR